MNWAGGARMLSATFAGTQVCCSGEFGLPNSGAFGGFPPTSSRNHTAEPGSVFAFQVLPTIIFISAFFAVLYHIGVMHNSSLRGMAWIMLKTISSSGAESMNVAASIFMGQTEAPLTIRPFLGKATRSELMTIISPAAWRTFRAASWPCILRRASRRGTCRRRDHDLRGNDS